MGPLFANKWLQRKRAMSPAQGFGPGTVSSFSNKSNRVCSKTKSTGSSDGNGIPRQPRQARPQHSHTQNQPWTFQKSRQGVNCSTKAARKSPKRLKRYSQKRLFPRSRCLTKAHVRRGNFENASRASCKLGCEAFAFTGARGLGVGDFARRDKLKRLNQKDKA